MSNEERGNPRRGDPILRDGSRHCKPLVSPDTMNFYISGPMSGLPNYNRHTFNTLESSIRVMCKSIDTFGNHKIFNPAKIPFADKKTYAQLMRECMIGLTQSTHFIQLPDWEHSHGALIEHSIAVVLEMKIISSKDLPKWLLENLNLTNGQKR